MSLRCIDFMCMKKEHNVTGFLFGDWIDDVGKVVL